MNEYRMVESWGRYNKRWEIQFKYTYYEKRAGQIVKVEGWKMVCKGSEQFCLNALESYRNKLKKNYKIPPEISLIW